MADVADVVPAAIDVKGNLVIWWCDAIANTAAPDVSSELDGTNSTRVTNSFTPGGFPLDGDQVVDTDSRLGLTVDLEALGIRTDTLGMLEYVESETGAAVALAPDPGETSKSGFFLVRRGVPYSTVATVGQEVLVIPVTLGSQIFPIQPDGKFLIKQRSSITGPIVRGTLAA